MAGWVVDPVGDRLILVLGAFVSGVAALLCAAAPTFLLVIVALLVMGAGSAMPTPAGSVAVRAAFPLRLRGMVMSIRQTGVPIGGFVAALILPSIAVSAGWRAALATAGGASIAIGLVALSSYRPGPRGVQAPGDSGSLLRVLTRDLTIAAISGMFLVASQVCLSWAPPCSSRPRYKKASRLSKCDSQRSAGDTARPPVSPSRRGSWSCRGRLGVHHNRAAEAVPINGHVCRGDVNWSPVI